MADEYIHIYDDIAHENNILDADPHFSIDVVSRAITNTTSKKISLMQYDHNSERFSFEIPRIVEGHDMLACRGTNGSVNIHYCNISSSSRNTKNSGIYPIKDLNIHPTCIDEKDLAKQKLTFTWLISKEATKYAGSLHFIIIFECYEDDKVIYRWNTDINKSTSITVGMNNESSITNSYPDVLLQWARTLELYMANTTDRVNELLMELPLFATTEEVEAVFSDEVNEYEPGTYYVYSGVDGSMSENSTNPVQNNIITNYINKTGIIIDSQDKFNSVYPDITNGGIYRITCDVIVTEDIDIKQPCLIFSDNNSEIRFDAGKFIFNAEVEIRGLKVTGHTYDFANTDGVINTHARCKIINCEINGLTDMTDDGLSSGNGGYGIAMFEGSDGTEIIGNYIHNVSNSFIENWHNNASFDHPQLTDLKILNNKLVDSETGDGIALNVCNSIIKGNSLNGKWENGFLVHPKNENGVNCENVTFEGNTFDVTTYQNIKNGYGIAIRQADDKLSTSVNCVVKNNIFNGWGNTTNGVEGIRVDETCKNTLVVGNVFPDKNIPTRAACIRDRGINTIIKENIFDLSKGEYAIQKCNNGGTIIGNIINNTGCRNTIDLIGSTDSILICDNIIDDTFNNYVISVYVDNVSIKRNKITCSKTSITTNTTSKNTIIEGNTIECGDTGIIVQNIKPSITNNIIISSHDCINVPVYCNGAVIKDNDLTVDTTATDGRDCLIIAGSDIVAIRNNFKASKRNTLKITTTASKKCTIQDNVFHDDSVIAIENYETTEIYFIGNDINNAEISIASTKPVIFINNRSLNKILGNEKCVVYDGILMQNAVPGSKTSNDVAYNYRDLIRSLNIIVENTGDTPHSFYKLMSDNTWLKIYL